MPHTCSKLLFHLVFSTKDRHGWLTDAIRPRVFSYLGGIVRELRGSPVVIGGMADHVHMLVQLPTHLSVAVAMRELKASSSRWIHQTWPGMRGFSWQTGYGAFTASESSKAEVIAYIERQPEHHQARDFRAEFMALLKKQGIEVDERYLWN